MIYSAAELASARAAAREILKDSAQVWRKPDAVSDGAGGRTSGAAVLVSTHAAMLDVTRGREGEAEQPRGVETGKLLLAHDVALRLTDTVRVAGDTWQVRTTNAAETDRLLLECEVTRVR